MELVYKRFPITKENVDRTISMLQNPSLWFSYPDKFIGDNNDANIGAFFHENPKLLEVAKKMDHLYLERIKDSLTNGICCFSKELPNSENWSMYSEIPSKDTIVVSYKKDVLEDFFANKGFGNCFSTVAYKHKPLSLKIKDDNINIKGKWIPLDFLFSGKDPKSMDDLWEIMLSRITNNYSKEDEVRIILANENKPVVNGKNGYSESIPSDAIYEVNCPDKIDESIKKRLKLLEN
jgi:hypothetical protein